MKFKKRKAVVDLFQVLHAEKATSVGISWFDLIVIASTDNFLSGASE